MNPIETETLIAAPCETVFAVFSDLEHAPERVRGIESLDVLTDGPMQVGTRFRETRIMMGRKATEIMTVTAFDRPSSYVVEANSCGCHYVSTYRFEPVAGGTRVSLSFSGTPTGFLSKCMLFLMKPFLKKIEAACQSAVQQDMLDLKTAIESVPQ